MAGTQTHISQWLLDTRPLWAVATTTPKAGMQEFKIIASKALSLLPLEEQEAVLKYYHVKDAKLSLGSQLLKHYAVRALLGVPWSQTRISRDSNGKPCFIASSSDHLGEKHTKRIEFNVSHQAGVVTMVACAYEPHCTQAGDGEEVRLQLGTDIVFPNERDDYSKIDSTGFFDWVDMHSDVFSPEETSAVKLSSLALLPSLFPASSFTAPPQVSGYALDKIARCQYQSQDLTLNYKGVDAGSQMKEITISARAVIEAKLRRFYALWCLREAYVKMTGEALLAAWLGDLEFRSFDVPAPSVGNLVPGEVISRFSIIFKGKQVEDVNVEMRAFGPEYMVASAARLTYSSRASKGATAKEEVVFDDFVALDLERDVYPLAEVFG